jgi:Flp pilus assembly pilin Flp
MVDRISFVMLATALELSRRFDDFRSRQDGQTMAEYAVLLAVITAAIIATLAVLAGNIDAVLTRVANAIK